MPPRESGPIQEVGSSVPGSIEHSKINHKLFWSLIKGKNLSDTENPTKEQKAVQDKLAHCVYQEGPGTSDPTLEDWETDGIKEKKEQKLIELLNAFFANPTPATGQAVGKFL